MAGTDQHLMYLLFGNTDVVSAQMNKFHSQYGSSARCQLLYPKSIP